MHTDRQRKKLRLRKSKGANRARCLKDEERGRVKEGTMRDKQISKDREID